MNYNFLVQSLYLFTLHKDVELTSVKNLPLKSWRQRRWFLLSAISIFPMLQWKTDPTHFLPNILNVPKPGVSKSRYIGISIPIKYSNFSRFYKKLGPFYKKLRCDKFGN